MTPKSSITTQATRRERGVPPVRPSNEWNDRYEKASPGEILAEEFLKPMGLSQNQLALGIRVPATRIGQIVRGKRAITPDTALRLARFFNTKAEFWLNLQQMHDLAKANLALAKAIEREVQVYEPSAA